MKNSIYSDFLTHMGTDILVQTVLRKVPAPDVYHTN